MRGAVILGGGKIVVREFPEPQVGPGEVLIDVRATGICGCSRERPAFDRDAEGNDEVSNVIGGHEASGVVVTCGPGVESLRVGDRVMVYHYTGCGRCLQCLSGWAALCKDVTMYGTSAHGGWADQELVREEMCIALPESLSFEEGSCCCCTAGTGYEALNKLSLHPGDVVTLYGVGSMGLMTLLLAVAEGLRVIAIEGTAARLQLAKDLGAWAVIDPASTDPVEAVLDLTSGRGADGAVDPTGSARSKENCLKSLKPWGRLVVLGEHSGTTAVPTQTMIRNGQSMVGSWGISRAGMLRLASLVDRLHIPLGDAITHRFSLEQTQQAFETYETLTTGKVVIEPVGGSRSSS